MDCTKLTIVQSTSVKRESRFCHDYNNINPGDISLDRGPSDQRELDKIVVEAMVLTEEEQLEVYKAVVELVKNRLVKAGSVH